MARESSRRVYFEVEASFRYRDGEPVCCYLTEIESSASQQRRIIDSKHIQGQGERFIDEVIAQIRASIYREVMPDVNPF